MDEQNQIIAKAVKAEMAKYLGGPAFTARKLTDTPTDANMVVPRKYVTMNGPSTGRPTSSVVGQQYFDTDLGFPVYWSGTTFVDSTGTPV